jgi:hypothetical protein
MIWDIDRAKMDPAFADELDTIPGNFAVIQGFRTPQQQNALWQQGRDEDGNVIDEDAVVTNARAFQSAHTVTDPLGEASGKPASLAGDLARVDENGHRVWDYSHPEWKALWAYVDAHLTMISGAHFPKADEDHVQSRRWYEAKRELIALGKWTTHFKEGG